MLTATTSGSAQVSHSDFGLLRLVLEDDGFRAKLQKDPRAALALQGYTIGRGMVPERVVLPGSEDLEQVLAQGEADSLPVNSAWVGFMS